MYNVRLVFLTAILLLVSGIAYSSNVAYIDAVYSVETDITAEPYIFDQSPPSTVFNQTCNGSQEQTKGYGYLQTSTVSDINYVVGDALGLKMHINYGTTFGSTDGSGDIFTVTSQHDSSLTFDVRVNVLGLYGLSGNLRHPVGEDLHENVRNGVTPPCSTNLDHEYTTGEFYIDFYKTKPTFMYVDGFSTGSSSHYVLISIEMISRPLAKGTYHVQKQLDLGEFQLGANSNVYPVFIDLTVLVSESLDIEIPFTSTSLTEDDDGVFRGSLPVRIKQPADDSSRYQLLLNCIPPAISMAEGCKYNNGTDLTLEVYFDHVNDGREKLIPNTNSRLFRGTSVSGSRTPSVWHELDFEMTKGVVAPGVYTFDVQLTFSDPI